MTGPPFTLLPAHTWMDTVLSLLRNTKTLTLQPAIVKSQLRFQADMVPSGLKGGRAEGENQFLRPRNQGQATGPILG